MSQSEVWPWLALAGLGAFHGLNPAMGWLFAVALGLHRHSRRMVWLSPVPIALGHALSIALVAGAFVLAGFAIDLRAVRIGAGLILIGWALYYWRYGHRHRVRTGMQTGLAALAVWSFLMATSHGAGLMLWPVLMPLCFPQAAESVSNGALPTALLGIAVHTLAMLIVTTAIAVAVYEWIGLEILRRAWFNVDLIWTLAILVAGGLLLIG
jgi:small neutral amino acid transporter SnatA (MarC family)